MLASQLINQSRLHRCPCFGTDSAAVFALGVQGSEWNGRKEDENKSKEHIITVQCPLPVREARLKTRQAGHDTQRNEYSHLEFGFGSVDQSCNALAFLCVHNAVIVVVVVTVAATSVVVTTTEITFFDGRDVGQTGA